MPTKRFLEIGNLFKPKLHEGRKLHLSYYIKREVRGCSEGAGNQFLAKDLKKKCKVYIHNNIIVAACSTLHGTVSSVL